MTPAKSDIVKEVPYKEGKIVVWVDRDPCNPRRAFENLGVMRCFHRRHRLGDERGPEKPEESTDDQLSAWLEKVKAICLRLYLYDHSGITISTQPFSCRWDSGPVGWIFVTRERARQEFGVKVVTKALRERILRILRREVEDYDDYLTGCVYGYTVYAPSGEILHSCGGFFGRVELQDHSYMLGEARGHVDTWYAERLESEPGKHLEEELCQM